MGKAGRHDEGISGFQRHNAVILPVLHPATLHIADLVVVMAVGRTDFTAGDAIDMVLLL